MTTGWERKPLREVCEFQRGLTYAKRDEVEVSENVVLRATNVDLKSSSLDLTELRYISDTINVPASKRTKKDSLLICTASGSKSHVGKVALVDKDYGYAFGGFMGQLTAMSGLLPKFMFYLLTSAEYKDFIAGLADGTNINNLKWSQLQEFEVCLPPLEEQKRIVAILDAAFAGLDAAQANTEQVATDGEDLFQEGLERVLSSSKHEWAESQLGSVTTKIGSGATPRGGEKAYKTSGTSLIRSLNVHDRGFQQKRLAFIDASQASMLSNVEVHEGDVLLNITGASVARCCIVDENILPARVNQHVSIIRPISDALDPEFLHYLLTSRTCKSRLLGIGEGAGSTRQAITKAQIQGFTIRYPASLRDQRRIVQEINALRSHTQQLGRIVDRKLASITNLRQSLLHQAFSGQL